jgi:hypothetical protein
MRRRREPSGPARISVRAQAGRQGSKQVRRQRWCETTVKLLRHADGGRLAHVQHDLRSTRRVFAGAQRRSDRQARLLALLRARLGNEAGLREHIKPLRRLPVGGRSELRTPPRASSSYCRCASRLFWYSSHSSSTLPPAAAVGAPAPALAAMSRFRSAPSTRRTSFRAPPPRSNGPGTPAARACPPSASTRASPRATLWRGRAARRCSTRTRTGPKWCAGRSTQLARPRPPARGPR